MAHIEHKVLQEQETSPIWLTRYVDDLCLEVRDVDHLKKLIEKFESNSVLKFTYELSHDNALPFLDVLIEASGSKFETGVYRKPTNNGTTMNARSECPDRYKKGVVSAFIRRAIRHSSTYEKMHQEFNRCKQLLVNNGFTNQDIDNEIRRQLEQTHKEKPTSETTHHVYYRNYMSDAYKTDERVLKDMIRRNIRCEEGEHLELHIYYTTKKTRNLIMSNKPVQTEPLKCTNVVYKFTCPLEGCRPQADHYIGVTTTTLSRRLTMHLQQGAIKQHMHDKHNTELTRKTLVQNTSIIASTDNTRKLAVLEALYIQEHKPSLNIQMNTH